MNDDDTAVAEAPPLARLEEVVCEAPDPAQEAEDAHNARFALEKRVFDALFPMTDLSGGDLLSHADRELRLAGLYDDDADYGSAIAHGVMRLMRVFASEGHSGGSAWKSRELFNLLADYRTLTPNDHSEYIKHEDDLWQCVRDSRYFSRDGGKTWQNVDDKAKAA